MAKKTIGKYNNIGKVFYYNSVKFGKENSVDVQSKNKRRNSKIFHENTSLFG